MSNHIHNLALSVDRLALERGDRLTVRQFIDMMRRLDKEVTVSECETAVLRLADEGRLQTHTNRPPLRTRGKAFDNFGIRKGRPCAS